MKVLICSRAPFVAGAEIAGERLAVGLMEANHEVLMVVGTRGEAMERFRNAGITCRYIPQQYTGKGLGFRYRRSRNELRALLKNEAPDLVHSNDLPTHQMTSDAAAPLNIPRVCHHRWIFEGGAVDWFNKFGCEEHLFVSSAAMRALMENSETLKNNKCTPLHDGLPIPGQPTEHDRQVAKTALRLSQDKKTVLFAGQIVERKGVADIIRAWQKLPEAIQQKTELVIVGDDLESAGAYKRQMESLANELNVAARFAGFQKNVPTWLTAADLVLVPSHDEPLGNATLEAMALGRPVIGASVGGIPEMILHEQTGMLIPPKDPDGLSAAIEDLIKHPQRLQTLGDAARIRCASSFSLQRHIDNVIHVYDRLLA